MDSNALVDQGNLNLTGAALLSTYVAGRLLVLPNSSKLHFFPRVTADGGGAGITSFTIKVQARGTDSEPWLDVESTDVSTNTTAVEHQYSSMPSAGATTGYGPIEIDARAYPGGVQALVKRAGTPAAADNVTLDAAASRS